MAEVPEIVTAGPIDRIHRLRPGQ